MEPENACCTCYWHDAKAGSATTTCRRKARRIQPRRIAANFTKGEASMTTKRLKKLLMAMGLSRNQVNRMVKEQRNTGSKKASNALYYHVFKQDFKLFASACGGEVLPYLNSFVLQ